MIYCQSCLAQNEADQLICRKCGNKLLVLGRNQQWEEPELPQISMEDHFLERISRLEETVSGILEHLSRMSESLEMVDRNAFITRSGLTALVETLRETNLLREELLNERWENTMANQMEEAGFRERFQQMRGRFLALYRGAPELKLSFAALLDEAEFLILSDRSRESIELLVQALQMDLMNYELAYYLAEYYQKSGLYDEALAHLRIALSANSDHGESLLMMALLHYANDENTEARAMLQRCLQNNPHNTLALLSMGSILTGDRQYEEAMPYLMRVNEIEPNAQAYFLLGLGAKDRGNLREAIAMLVQATELDPTHEDAVFTLGLTYLARGWSKKARACFVQAQALNPGRLEFSDFDEPTSQVTASSLDENLMEQLKHADDLFHRGLFKQALPEYRQLLKKHPNHPLLLCSYAVINYAMRRYDATLRVTQKLLNLQASPAIRCVCFTLQMEALRALGRLTEVLTLLTTMRAEFPDGYGRTVANYGLAMAKADLGKDLHDAEFLAREAVELSPPEFRHNALDALGWVYFKQGRYEEALEILESVVSMRESTSHLYHYGMILLTLNLQEEASKVFERTVKLRTQTIQIDEFIFAAINREMGSTETNDPS